VVKAYAVPAVNADSFSGIGPAIPCGQWGLNETLQQRLSKIGKSIPINSITKIDDLAKALIKGEFVMFIDEEEKTKVLKRASEIAHIMANSGSEHTGELVQPQEVSFEGLTEEQIKSLEPLLNGVYIPPRSTAPGPVGTITTLVRKNDSYRLKEEESLLKKVRSMIAVPAPKKAPKNVARKS
jgi:hypothetical protein